MTEENCQVADGLIGLVSSITADEIEDVEKGLRFIEKLAGDILEGRVELKNLLSVRTLAEIHRARLQRQRIAWERASVFQKIGLTMQAKRARMSDFDRRDFIRRNGR